MKRIFDLLASALGLVLVSPVLLAVALAIKLEDGGPVFYRGTRVGMGGQPFRIFKFRSMVVDAEKRGASSTSQDDPRITRVGAFIRSKKIDELPQLFNVLLGEMSVVGPRPQVSWAVDRYTSDERLVLSVRPGITDPASLYFYNEGELLKGSLDPDKDYMERIHPEKMRLSLEYVRQRSFSLDLKIILKTFSRIAGRSA